jgi:2-methylcitrate dehydratase PrpD
MEGAHTLVKTHEIALEDIAAIRVEGFHETVRLGARLPTTTEEAQFNVAWPLAAMLVDGEVGPNQMLEARLDDPRIARIAQKVQIHESDELNELRRLYEVGDPRGRFASIVTITLDDGRSFNSGLVEANEQHPPVGWDDDRIAEKFRWLAGHVLSEVEVQGLLETLWRFDKVSDVREFTQVLA